MNYHVYHRRIAFHETDMMGVVHHSNHIKFYEEARVDWMRAVNLIDVHIPRGKLVLAVTETKSRYLRTLRFEDEIEVRVQAKMEGARVFFQYAVFNKITGEKAAEGMTELVPLDEALKPTRLPVAARAVFQAQPWTPEGL